jgi:signal transduction histidine kinase
LVAVAITHARAIQVDPLDHADRYYVHLQSAFDVGPVMACPLAGEAEVRGAIVVGRRAGRSAFSSTDLDMAEAFASHAAVALELADARADQQRLNVLEDRHRIARDLHDHVIQRLFATGLTTQATSAMSGDPRVSNRLEAIVDDIDETIRQIRSSIFELQDPPGTDNRSLRGSVLKIIKDVEPVLGFRAQVAFDGPVDTMVDDDLLHDLEAVLREALTNIGKHAAATVASIRIVLRRDDLQVAVRDNGTETPEVTRRSGLANLADRADHRAGSMEFDRDEEGTVLRWTAKLNP